MRKIVVFLPVKELMLKVLMDQINQVTDYEGEKLYRVSFIKYKNSLPCEMGVRSCLNPSDYL